MNSNSILNFKSKHSQKISKIVFATCNLHFTLQAMSKNFKTLFLENQSHELSCGTNLGNCEKYFRRSLARQLELKLDPKFQIETFSENFKNIFVTWCLLTAPPLQFFFFAQNFFFFSDCGVFRF